MRSTGIRNCAPKVPADQFALDQTLKQLRKLCWIGRELEAQKILQILDDTRLQPSLPGDRRKRTLRLDSFRGNLSGSLNAADRGPHPRQEEHSETGFGMSAAENMRAAHELTSNRTEKEAIMDLEEFLLDANIARYRRLLDSSIDETERRALFKLLAEEGTRLKNEDQKGW
jgi:hypothetical protein